MERLLAGKRTYMREITLEELLEAGCHFGHQVTRQNPKARDFIFEARDGIHIIDLTKTKEGLDEAAEFIKNLASKPDTTLLVVGTKRQAKGVVEEEIERVRKETGNSRIFYIRNRWIGGLFTNFTEIEKNFKKLREISEKLENPEETVKYTKKEIDGWRKDMLKLEIFYGGVKDMKGVPSAIYIIDSNLEEIAVKEAGKVGVPTVAIVDTNSNPEVINYPIPANDDATGSIKIITAHIMDAWIEGIKNADMAASKAESKKVVEGDAEKPKEKTSEKPKKEPKKSSTIKKGKIEKPKAKKIKNVKS